MTGLFPTTLTEDQIATSLGMAPPWCHHFHFKNHSTGGLWDERHMNFIEDNLPPLRGKSVLDIGFADGYYSFMAEAHGARSVTGFDLYYRPAAQFVHKVLDSECTFMEGDIMEWEAPVSFDLVLCMGVFYHVPDIAELFRKVAEKTRPGGLAVFEGPVMGGRLNRVVPLPRWVGLARHPALQPNHGFWRPTLSSLKALLWWAGFEVVEQRFMWERVLLTARRCGSSRSPITNIAQTKGKGESNE